MDGTLAEGPQPTAAPRRQADSQAVPGAAEEQPHDKQPRPVEATEPVNTESSDDQQAQGIETPASGELAPKSDKDDDEPDETDMPELRHVPRSGGQDT